MTLYPLLLDSALHIKVWGGRKLETVMGKRLPTDDPYGESWEMHDTGDGCQWPAGRALPLHDVLAEYGHDLVGPANDPGGGFSTVGENPRCQMIGYRCSCIPTMNRRSALEGESRGKTEAWYVIAAEPGAKAGDWSCNRARLPIRWPLLSKTTRSKHCWCMPKSQPGDVLFVQRWDHSCTGAGPAHLRDSAVLRYYLSPLRLGPAGAGRPSRVNCTSVRANRSPISIHYRRLSTPATDQFAKGRHCAMSEYFTTLLYQLNHHQRPALQTRYGRTTLSHFDLH